MEKDLREMFEVIKPIAFNKPVRQDGRGEYYLREQLKAAEACAHLAIAIVKVRKQQQLKEETT